MSDILNIESIELDLPIATDQCIESAKRVFGTDIIRKKGKYAAEPTTFIGIIASITTADVTKDVIVSLIGSGFIFGFQKTVEFLRTLPQPAQEKQILATITIKATGILWEIRFDPKRNLTDYLKGLVISSVDITDLSPDAYRVSINLVDGYAKAYDEQKQFICDLPFDNPIKK